MLLLESYRLLGVNMRIDVEIAETGLCINLQASRGQLKCGGTRLETRFRLSVKRTSPFKSARASVQSTTGSRGVRISGSNAGYTMFRGSVKSTGYPLRSPVSPFTSSPVRHRVPSHFNWSLMTEVASPHKNLCSFAVHYPSF